MNDKCYRVSGRQLWQWHQEAREAAIAANVPANEIDILLQEFAGLDRLALRLESFKDWPQIDLQLPFQELSQRWQQRIERRVPIQYLIGVAYWRQFSLTVSPDVLIPRPGTECLIDLAVAAVQDVEGESGSQSLSEGHWVDLGTGSGAIAIALADAFSTATIHAVDVSANALQVAQGNAQRLGFGHRIQFHRGEWWQPLNHLKHRVSGMVSNPPYIPEDMVPQLQPEIVHHEPHLAIDGGTDGLAYVRHLIETAPHYLHPGGIWLVELMIDQAPTVVELLQQQGDYSYIQVHPDLEGIDRFVLARRREL